MSFKPTETEIPKTEAKIDGMGMLSSPKLCLDAISEAWGYQKHKNPADFEIQVENELNLKNATHMELNSVYMGKVLEAEKNMFGSTKVKQIYDAGKKGLVCND